MKKIKILFLVIILASSLIAACANGEESSEYEETGYDTSYELEESNEFDEIEENDYDTVDSGDELVSNEASENHIAAFEPPDWLAHIQITEGTRNIMLEDFDYLTRAMLESAPTLGVFERRFGGSMEGTLVAIRHVIYSIEPVGTANHAEDQLSAAAHLSRLFDWFATSVRGLGHFGILPLVFYMDFLESFSALLHQSEIIDGRAFLDGEEAGDERIFRDFVERISSEETLRFYGVDLAELNLYRDVLQMGFHMDGNVRTEIIAEDQIAYLRIQSFINNGAFDSAVLFPFFQQVQNFEHLIIDLRGNGGGYANYFTNYIIAMLIDDPIEVRLTEFVTAGDDALREVAFSQEWSIRGPETAEEILLASDFVNQQQFSHFNEADLDFLQYVVRWHSVIEPRPDNIPFSGEIWLLVDQRSASASELAAMQSISSGFATVVGTHTAGITPTMAAFVVLPNTGILFRIDMGYMIDEFGRSMEEFGVPPDIIIEPGFDALEVVLDLIARGVE